LALAAILTPLLYAGLFWLYWAGVALTMAAEIAGQHRVTLGADKGYDQKGLVRELRAHQVTPHVARKVHSAIDRRTTRHPGYAVSETKRKRVEEIFGWMKTIGGLRKTRHQGAYRVGWVLTFAAAAYNLVRMRNLLPIATLKRTPEPARALLPDPF
jgi:IS5 family transposase